MGAKKAKGQWSRYEKGNASYDSYMHSDVWRRKANERMEIDDRTCQVCGKRATEVHHLTYENFRAEKMDDLVSLCHACHEKAEEIYQPSMVPYAMAEKKPGGNNFMAALRVDSAGVAEVVHDYLIKARGDSFNEIMILRQPPASSDNKHYGFWTLLHKAVDALCRKRYSFACAESERSLMLDCIEDHAAVMILGDIEHRTRNSLQADLRVIADDAYAKCGTLDKTAEFLDISKGTLSTIRSTRGESFGPSVREVVLTYCAKDAAYGIRPWWGFNCLTSEDYAVLDHMADYVASVSGNGAFKGEYTG